MAVSLKHAFVSPVLDNGKADEVGPNEWNAEHEITTDQDTVLGRVSTGAGAVEPLTPAQVRTLLSLGTIALQNASGVAITGGSITGITDLAIADGGTGASTVTGVLSNLGLDPIISLDAFGSIAGDGSTDDTAAINAALALGYKRYFIPAKTYRIDGTITKPNGVSLIGAGMGQSVFDGSQTTFASLTGGLHVTNEGATLTALPALNADAEKGANSIVFASAPSVVAGDYISIYNPTDSSYSSWRTAYRQGVIVRVATVSGSTVTLQGTLPCAVTAADFDCYLIEDYDTCVLSDFTIKGLGDTSNGTVALDLNDFNRSVLERVECTGASYTQISIERSIDWVVRDCIAQEDFSSDFSTDYGTAISNCQNGRIEGGHHAGSRHGISFGGNGDTGAPINRFVRVVGANIATSSSVGVNAADFHGNTEYCSYEDCTIFGGVNLSGNFNALRGNRIFARAPGAVTCILASEFTGTSHVIDGNQLTVDSGTPTSSRGFFIDIGGNSNVIYSDTDVGGLLQITNNSMTSDDAIVGTYFPMYVTNRGYAGTDVDMLVSGNTISLPEGSRTAYCWFRNLSASTNPFNRLVFRDNTFSGCNVLRFTGTSSNYCANTLIFDTNLARGGDLNTATVQVERIRDVIQFTNNVFQETGLYIFLSGRSGANVKKIIHKGNNYVDANVGRAGTSVIEVDVYFRYADRIETSGNTTGSLNEFITVDDNSDFIVGEPITDGTSGATATVLGFRSTTEIFIGRTRSGNFGTSNTITGSVSAETATVSAGEAYTTGFRYRIDTVSSLQMLDPPHRRTAGSSIIADSLNSVTYAAGSKLIGTATYDPASLNDGDGATTTVTVTGAAVGDTASASFSNALQGITVTAWVSAANTVSVRFQNESGGTLDLASGTIYARVEKV